MDFLIFFLLKDLLLFHKDYLLKAYNKRDRKTWISLINDTKAKIWMSSGFDIELFLPTGSGKIFNPLKKKKKTPS